MSLYHRDYILCPIYITINNLHLKIWQSQIYPGTLLLQSIPIVYKFLEDGDNKGKDLKAKIYQLAFTTML